MLPLRQESVPRMKSALLVPLTTTLDTASAPAYVPVLLSVTCSVTTFPEATPVPSAALPKLMLVFEGAMEIDACTASPESDTVDGVPDAMLSVAERGPGEPDSCGWNVTLSWQLLLAARVGAHGFVTAKSPAFVPLREIPDMDAVADPAFKIVTICAALVVPVLCAAKVRLAGETCRSGAAVAVPLSETCCGLAAGFPRHCRKK